jgi:hypothetical protein
MRGSLGMKIRFSEHITSGHREGILEEIVEMGATPEQLDQDVYVIAVSKSTTYSFVFEFLRKEQQIGTLELDEAWVR